MDRRSSSDCECENHIKPEKELLENTCSYLTSGILKPLQFLKLSENPECTSLSRQYKTSQLIIYYSIRKLNRRSAKIACSVNLVKTILHYSKKTLIRAAPSQVSCMHIFDIQIWHGFYLLQQSLIFFDRLAMQNVQ